MRSTEEVLTKDCLLKISRMGMLGLVGYMEDEGFFVSPASTRFHLSVPGGLAVHSWGVYLTFRELLTKFDLEEQISEESMMLVSFLHDLCKAGAYIREGERYRWNGNHPSGHAKLSLEKIKKFIVLTKQEEDIIKYHMGFYGAKEFSQYGEYSLVELAQNWNENKLGKLFHIADELSTHWGEKA